MIKNVYQTEKGFTLIELLLVISIISLLSTVFFFNITEAKKKGEDAHMQVEAGEVGKAIELYKLDNDGRAPDYSLKGQMVREGSAEYAVAMNELVTRGYLPEAPTSPSGESYSYMTSSDRSNYVFNADLNYPVRSAIGPDGRSNANRCSFIEPQVNEDMCLMDAVFVSDINFVHNCTTIEVPEGFRCTSLSQTSYELCPYVNGGGVCDNSSSSDFCICS